MPKGNSLWPRPRTLMIMFAYTITILHWNEIETHVGSNRTTGFPSYYDEKMYDTNEQQTNKPNNHSEGTHARLEPYNNTLYQPKYRRTKV